MDETVGFLSGGGEMGALMRSHDWSLSPLGSPASWPQSLRAVVALMINSRYPMFIAWGPELAFLYNDGYAPIFGAKHPHMLGRPFREAWSEIWADLLPLIERALAGEATFSENLHLVMERNGYPEDTWYSFSYSPVRDETGAVAGMFCACTETTQQVLAQRKMGEERERLHQMFEQAPGFVALLEGPQHVFAFANAAYRNLVGGRDVVGLPVRAALPEVAGQGLFELLDQVFASGDAYRGKATAIRLVRQGDGPPEERFVDFIYQPITDASGKVVRIFVEGSDVTERVLAEAALRESEGRYRQIVEGAEDFAIIALDEAGLITSWNSGAERMIGFTAEEAIGRPGQIFFTDADNAAGVPDHEMNRAKTDGRAVNERWHRRKDGSRFWGSGLIMRLDASSGGYLKIFRDRTPEHEAEAELRRTEARFREQFENANDFIFTTDLEMQITSCNPAVAAALGLTPDELAGRSIAEFVPPDMLHRNKEMLAAKLQGQATTRYEVDVLGRGRRMTWEINSRLTRDRSGKPNGLHGIARDVTERRRAETALRESEARLRALTDHLPGGMVYQIATGADGSERRFVYVSQSHEQLTGISAEAVLADPTIPYQLIHPDDRPRLAAAEAEAIRSMISFDVQARFRRADGQERWCRLISAPREQDDGSMIWDGIQIDITEQKAAEEALLVARSRAEAEAAERSAILGQLAEGVIVTDAAGRITFVNEAATRLHGVGALAVEPGDYSRTYHLYREDGSPYPPEELPLARAVLHGETMVDVRWRICRPDGTDVLAIGTAQPLRGADGSPQGAVLTLRDDTARNSAELALRALNDTLEQRVEERTAELVQAHEQLRQSQKLEAMGQLTGGVAHDFNNLLSPIIGGLDLLKRRGLGGEREQRLIGGALQSAERAKMLVQRLLAFARRQPLKPGAVDIAALVSGMADLIASTSGPQIKLMVDFPDKLPPAKADPNQLEMAILNLGVNARDAMPNGGTLTISAATEAVRPNHRSKLKAGDYLRLSVADTGIGMDEATMERAIEPFFSTKGIGKGTGLGLSMVHGLASQLGGGFAIESKPGLGTCVELWLPLSDEQAGDAEASRPKPPPKPGRGTALLVDDEELVRMSTADMLAEFGYEVIEAASAAEALEKIHNGLDVDLLVTDHMMPGMSGVDLAREVRSRVPGTPVLIVSGYAETDGIAPDLPRLTKPFRQAELAACLGALSVGEGSSA